MKIDKKHPRALSLNVREMLADGVKKNLVSLSGLIAHGRGEAFDYLIGEKTQKFAKKSIEAASAMLLLSEKPILSINGNVASIALKDYIKLAKTLNCKIEVNLFHFTKKRIKAIEDKIRKIDRKVLLSSCVQKKMIIPEIASNRKIVLRDGIGSADTVLVPLEDGDRCQALVKFGKKVVTVDLNPLSRTASSSTVTIVDNILRTLPLLTKQIIIQKSFNRQRLEKIVRCYDNRATLNSSLIFISQRLMDLSSKKIMLL